MKPWGWVVVAAALATPLVATSRVAADGEPEPGFGVNGVMIDASFSGGKRVVTQDVVQLRNGKFVVSGQLEGLPDFPKPFIARYLSTGQPDPTFGSGGVAFPGVLVAELAPLDGERLAGLNLASGGRDRVIIEGDGTTTVLPDDGAFMRQQIRRPDGAILEVGRFNTTLPTATVLRLFHPNGAVEQLPADINQVTTSHGLVRDLGTFAFGESATLLSDGRVAVAFSVTADTCGVVAFKGDGNLDPTFGEHEFSKPAGPCRIDHLADDEIRLETTVPVTSLSSDGDPLGALPAPFDADDLLVEGTGYVYASSSPNELVAYDPFGSIDPTFGVNGTATLAGMDAVQFKLLDSGDIVAVGTPTGTQAALAIGVINASFGTALQPPAVDTNKFVPVAPTRILDTRDGIGAPKAKPGPGGQVDLQIAGVAGVPDTDISAVVLNVTATASTQAGFVSLYPSGTRLPLVSNLNLEAVGQTAANLVTVKVGSNGKVTIFTSGGSDLIADVAGYYTPTFTSTDGRLQTAAPERILDTRSGLGASPGKLGAGGQLDLQVTGRGPVPSTGVSAVVLNITGDQASADGFVTAWPTGSAQPVVSNLNLVTGETRPNLAIVPLGADGKISLYTSGGANLIADVAGWFTDTTASDEGVGLFVPVNPTRMLDTRQEPTAPTAPGSALDRLIGSTTVVPPNSTIAVAANITLTQSGGPGFVTAWPSGTALPGVSNLNSTHAGQTIPNAAIVPLNNDNLALYTQSGAQLIVDINGWFTNF